MNSRSAIDKTIIVTGAAGGIGAATARELVSRGAHVLLTDSDGNRVEEIARSLGDRALAAAHDVRCDEDWSAAVAFALDRFGGIDGLVNNAGVFLARPLTETSAEEFRRVLDINTTGVFLGIRHVAEVLRERGGGVIVNVSSVAGLTGTPNLAAYSASKWAVRGLTRVAARELAGAGIRVNSIHPGQIDTEMNARQREAAPAAIEAIIRATPMRRLGQAEEIAEIIAVLLSDASAYMTGSEIVVDGGLTA